MQALFRHLRLPRVKAIGLSGGGIVLLHMATLDPASIEAMVVVSAPPYFPAQGWRSCAAIGGPAAPL
jgi:pimeloyl-ACP methyl ester carboxylesterase